MNRQLSRRGLIKTTVGVAGAAAVGTALAPSRSIAAPAFVRQTGSKVKALYWGSYSAELGKAEQEVVRLFNESQQDVELEYQFQGTYEETAQKLTAALAAKQAPDVVLLSDVWWFKFYLNRVLAPLDDLIAARGIDTADYVESLYNEGVRDGVSYWLPFARSTPLFYYNKDAFAAAGLEDRGPENWAEFQEWAPALVKKEGDTVNQFAFGHPNSGGYIAWLFQPVVWAFGGAYSDPDFTIRLAEAGAVEAGEMYRRSVVDGWASVTDDHEIDFTNGVIGAITASTGSMAGIKERAGFEFGTAFLPGGDDPKLRACTGGAGLAIMAGSPPERQEAAFRFIEFATSPEITTFWSQNTGYMPVRKSAAASPEMQAFYDENPTFKTAVDQLALTKPQDAARVFIPNGDQIIGGGLERITVNAEEVQPVFDEVAQTLEEEARPVIEALAALG